MNMILKRMGAILLCAALVMSFASCGKKNAEEETTLAPETTAETVTEEPTTEEPTTEETTAEPTTVKKTSSDAKKSSNNKSKQNNNSKKDSNSSKSSADASMLSASGKPLPPKKQKPRRNTKAVQPIFSENATGPVYEGSQSKGLCDVFDGSLDINTDSLFPYPHRMEIRGCSLDLICVFYPDGDVCTYAEITNLDAVYNSCVESLEDVAHLEQREVTPEMRSEYEAAAKSFTDALKNAFPTSETLKYTVSGNTIHYSDGSSEQFKVYQNGLVLTDEYGSMYLSRMKYK